MSPPIVFILDRDLGFVFWLGEIFSEAGCQTVPTMNSEQALSIIRELKLQVDIVVADLGLAGVSAMIQAMSDGRSLKIVAIRGDDDPGYAIQAHATLERPSASSQISREEWLARVRELLREIVTTRHVKES
jgi:DNA-binding NarL/FixJ family response regulator